MSAADLPPLPPSCSKCCSLFSAPKQRGEDWFSQCSSGNWKHKLKLVGGEWQLAKDQEHKRGAEQLTHALSPREPPTARPNLGQLNLTHDSVSQSRRGCLPPKPKEVECPQCSHRFIPPPPVKAEEVERASVAEINCFVGGKWSEVLEAYMLGRQLVGELPEECRGHDIKVIDISVQCGHKQSCQCAGRADVWKSFWNHAERVHVKGGKKVLPTGVQGLCDELTTALSDMFNRAP